MAAGGALLPSQPRLQRYQKWKLVQESSLMFRSPSGFRVCVKALAAALLMAAAMAGFTGQAQSRSPRRETNANRRARIEKQIQETYTHRWEVAGGGGYL